LNGSDKYKIHINISTLVSHVDETSSGEKLRDTYFELGSRCTYAFIANALCYPNNISQLRFGGLSMLGVSLKWNLFIMVLKVLQRMPHIYSWHGVC